MMSLRTPLLGLAAAAVAGSLVFAGSHSDEPPAVKARKAQMQLQSFNVGVLSGMMKGDVEFDAEAAQAAADRLAALTGYSFASYWTDGTSSDDIEGTRALPAIWENPDDVEAKRQALHDAAVTLAENAGTLEGLQANFGAVGGACGGCHQSYRQSN